MTTGLPRVLFVSHEATRTGAPKVLLSVLRWARANTDLSFEVLLRRGGPLQDDFAAVAPIHVFDQRPPNAWSARLERELGRGALQTPVLRVARSAGRHRLRHLTGFDVVYLNSAVSASVIDLLAAPRRMMISHIHELEIQLEHSLHQVGDRDALFGRTHRWIAAGDAVRANLEAHGVDADRIAIHREFIALPAPPDPTAVREARERLGIPEDAIVVGTMATIEPRKGPDLFVVLAQQLRSTYGDRVHLLWIGAPTGSPWQWPMEEDIRRAGLGDILHLAGELDDPFPCLALMDVLVLASREDPFPLACLEAAASASRSCLSRAAEWMSSSLTVAVSSCPPYTSAGWPLRCPR